MNLKQLFKVREVDQIKNRTRYGFLLWFLVLLGYFLFVGNWIMTSRLEGSVASGLGWINHFFSTQPSAGTTQAINYTITFMRGVGSLAAGWVLVKVGHKYAVLIALALLSFGFPTVFFPNYGLFIAGRMVMAIGGTVLIVYTQPIISNFFKKNKTRGFLNLVNSLGFNIGAAIAIVPFLFINQTMLQDWKLASAIVAGLPIALLAIYAILGVQFHINVASDAGQAFDKKVNMLTVAKERNTWKMVAYFGPWLVASVIPIFVLTPGLISTTYGLRWVAWEVTLPVLLYFLGLIPGIYLVGWITRTNVDRRAYIAVVTLLGMICVAMAYISEILWDSVAGSCIFFFLASLLFGGIEGVALTVPHEFKGNSPRKIGIVFGFVWGIGYVIYSLGNIIVAEVIDAFGPTPTTQGVKWAMVVYFLISIPALIAPFFLEKTRPDKFWHFVLRKTSTKASTTPMQNTTNPTLELNQPLRQSNSSSQQNE